MRYRHIFLTALLFLVISFSWHGDSFSEVTEEKEEKTLEVQKLMKRPYSPRLSFISGLFTGYDSNVNLSPESEGDMFEEFLFSLNVRKPWIGESKLTFDYDMDVVNYNDITDGTSILNHVRLGAHKKLFSFNAGAGYDLGIVNYPYNDDGNYLFHKGFFYLGNYLLKNLYHKLLFEAGLKDYRDKKALSDTIDTYQGDEREDKRQSVEYSILTYLKKSLLLKLKAKFSVNNSNARYLDFYDYNSYQISPRLDYKLRKDLEVFSRFTYLRKDYKSRDVTSENYKQEDDIYAATAGMRYRLNKNNAVSLFYTYRNNSSNDSLEKYTENVVTMGWQFKF